MDMVEGSGFSRRNVVAALAASGLVAACGKSAAVADSVAATSTAAAAADKLARGAMADWSARAGTVFQAGGGIGLTLAGVEALPSSGTRPPEAWRPAAFLAVFDAAAPLPGGLIHTLSAPGLGPLELFLANAASDAFPRRMHAVFN